MLRLRTKLKPKQTLPAAPVAGLNERGVHFYWQTVGLLACLLVCCSVLFSSDLCLLACLFRLLVSFPPLARFLVAPQIEPNTSCFNKTNPKPRENPSPNKRRQNLPPTLPFQAIGPGSPKASRALRSQARLPRGAALRGPEAREGSVWSGFLHAPRFVPCPGVPFYFPEVPGKFWKLERFCWVIQIWSLAMKRVATQCG